MQPEAHGDGLSEQRELREIGIFDIGNLRGIVLVGMHINEMRLVLGESGVFLDAVDLDEEGVGVIAVEMEEREFSATSTNKKFRGAVMEPRTQNPPKLAVEPVGEEIRRLGVDVGEKLRQKVFKNGIAEVWSGILAGRRTYAIDEIRHGVLLAVDGETLGSILGFEIVA